MRANENFISEIGFEKSSAKWLSADSTVVALYGATAGQVSFVAKDLTTNQAVCGLIPKPNYRYFNYLQLVTSVTSLANLARGSAQQNISKGIVETTRVVLPDEVVLRAFDTTLDPILKKWGTNLKVNITLAALRDTLLPKLISGELRVPDAERFCVEAGL
jgi:type I restriction enzyme S subunit